MRILIVEDELISRQVLRELLAPYGQSDVAADGAQAISAFKRAFEESKPYDLICMDIVMPNIDGQQALKEIRSIEKEKGIRGSNKIKVIMTTALEDSKNVLDAFYYGGADAYLVKPIEKQKLLEEMSNLHLA